MLTKKDNQIKKELKSTNPHKINKRKGKQKEIIMKLHHLPEWPSPSPPP